MFGKDNFKSARTKNLCNYLTLNIVNELLYFLPDTNEAPNQIWFYKQKTHLPKSDYKIAKHIAPTTTKIKLCPKTYTRSIVFVYPTA